MIDARICFGRDVPRVLVAVVLALLMPSYQQLSAQPSPAPSAAAHADGHNQALSSQQLHDLTTTADLIVVGRVGSMASEWNQDKSRISTRVNITVRETIKGQVPGNVITITTPGGEIDGVGEWYSHMASFARNEEVVVFASKDKSGRYNVSQGEIGKFSINKNLQTGAQTIGTAGTLDEFRSQIQQSLQSPDKNGERR